MTSTRAAAKTPAIVVRPEELVREDEIAIPLNQIGRAGPNAIEVGVGAAMAFGPTVGVTAMAAALFSDNRPSLSPEATQQLLDRFTATSLSNGGSTSVGVTQTRNSGDISTAKDLRLTLTLPSLRGGIPQAKRESHELIIQDGGSITKPYLNADLLLRCADKSGKLSFDLSAQFLSLLRESWGHYGFRRAKLADGTQVLAVRSPSVSYSLNVGTLGARAEKNGDGLGGHLYGAELNAIAIESQIQLARGSVPMSLQLKLSGGATIGDLQVLPGKQADTPLDLFLHGRVGAVYTARVGGFDLSVGGELSTITSGDRQPGQIESTRTQASANVEAKRQLGRVYVAVGAELQKNTAKVQRAADEPVTIDRDKNIQSTLNVKIGL